MDGLELIKRLRADPMTAALPIIMLTAKGLTVDDVLRLTAWPTAPGPPLQHAGVVARFRSTCGEPEFRDCHL